MDTYQPRFPHKPSDTLARAVNIVCAAQLSVDTRSAIDATALGMDSLDPL